MNSPKWFPGKVIGTLSFILVIFLLSLLTYVYFFYSLEISWDKGGIVTVRELEKLEDNQDDDKKISESELYTLIPASVRDPKVVEEEKIEMKKKIQSFYELRVKGDEAGAMQLISRDSRDALGQYIDEWKKEGWKFIDSGLSKYEVLAYNYSTYQPESSVTYENVSAVVRLTFADGHSQDEIIGASKEMTKENSSIQLGYGDYVKGGTDILYYYGKLHLVLRKVDASEKEVLIASNKFNPSCSMFGGPTEMCQIFVLENGRLEFISHITNFYDGSEVKADSDNIYYTWSFGDGGTGVRAVDRISLSTKESTTEAQLHQTTGLEEQYIEKAAVAKCKAGGYSFYDNNEITAAGEKIYIVECAKDTTSTTIESLVVVVYKNKVLKEFKRTNSGENYLKVDMNLMNQIQEKGKVKFTIDDKPYSLDIVTGEIN